MVGHKRRRSGSSLTLQLCPWDLVAVVCGFHSSYCSCATCSSCCCPRGSCWCWCSSFAYSSPYSRWQFNSLSTNGRKLLADIASRFLLAGLLACLVHYRPPTYASLSAPSSFLFPLGRSVNWVVVQSLRSRLFSLPSQRGSLDSGSLLLCNSWPANAHCAHPHPVVLDHTLQSSPVYTASQPAVPAQLKVVLALKRSC